MSESTKVRVLATDMDGTLIPLDGFDENVRDLLRLQTLLAQNEIELIYVTGRHLDLVKDAVESHELPLPTWLICDVGASIYHTGESGDYESVAAYAKHLGDLVGDFDRELLVQTVAAKIELTMQESEKQTRFKISYYCDADEIVAVTGALEEQLAKSRAPYRVIASVDPFTGVGLVDLLPRGVSKAYALQWWATHTSSRQEAIVFAGDSGNDTAALTAGYRSIVVGNASAIVVEAVTEAHRSAGWSDRLFVAPSAATSGVLEGMVHFLQR